MAVDKNGKKLPKGITQRSDGRYMGRLEYKGEKYTVYDMSLPVLKKSLENLRYEVRHGIHAKEENITVASWFNTWIKEHKQNSVKAGTLQTYNHTFNKMLKPTIGNKKLKDVTQRTVQKLINDFYDEEYSKSTLNLFLVVLRDMYEKAVKDGIVMRNPTEKVTLPKFARKEEKRVLTLEEQNLFLKYSKGSAYYDFYLMALCTGMRCNEILGLQWSDIDFKDKIIRVRGTLVYLRGKGRFKDSPKTESSNRDIPMIAAAEEMLKARRKMQIEDRLLLGEKWKVAPGLDNMIFTSRDGALMWDIGIRANMKKIIEKIESREGISFEPITPHTFRHPYVKLATQNILSFFDYFHGRNPVPVSAHAAVQKLQPVTAVLIVILGGYHN